MMPKRILLAVALGSIAIIAPLIAPNDYIVGTLARICLYATLALGLNIVVGFAGLLDIGYVAFFGIGSYIYALLCSPHFGLHLPFLLALPIVVVVTALFGILIGAPTLRLGGDYLAIVTLGFGEITYLLLLNLDRPVNITNGPSGIIGIDPPALSATPRAAIRSTTICSWRCWRWCWSRLAGCSIRASAGRGRQFAKTSSLHARWESTR